ncbi:hypothetical protein V1477_021148 [Vespula maculifrons]|uniref:Uncharacterized protein n=1 Tax=Vespula maculifrons TaxID=7453 RepID=A0ABD2AHA6_VESMC
MIKSACTIKRFTVYRDNNVSPGTLLNFALNILCTFTSACHCYTSLNNYLNYLLKEETFSSMFQIGNYSIHDMDLDQLICCLARVLLLTIDSRYNDLKDIFPSLVPPFESSIVKQYYIDFEKVRRHANYTFFLPFIVKNRGNKKIKIICPVNEIIIGKSTSFGHISILYMRYRRRNGGESSSNILELLRKSRIDCYLNCNYFQRRYENFNHAQRDN